MRAIVRRLYADTERPIVRGIANFGGGGDQDSTTTTNASYPEESKPLFKAAVEDILQAQGLLPIAPFTQWQPAGTAGIAPAHTYGMEELFPAAMAPTAGLQGLLALGPQVGQAAQGAVGASGPLDAEQMAMQRLLGLDAGTTGLGAARQAAPSFSLPQFDLSTVFPGLSMDHLQASSRDIAHGAVPVMGGWGMDTITPTSPMADLAAPTALQPAGYTNILPPGARDQFQAYVAEGYPTGMAYQQALQWWDEQEEGAEADQAPPPPADPPPFVPDGSPGGL